MLATAALTLALATAGPTVDNPYFPLPIGRQWVYREGEQRVEVTVTDRTRRIANGVEARVVRDEVTLKGVPVEITDDYYAQDAEGNVWYLGEATTEYEHGRPVSTEGSFEAGVDGARAGIAMPAHPKVGMRYRQEFYEGHAEDRAKIVSLRERVKVPLKRYRNTLMTLDSNPLEPDVLEAKFYACGVGMVLAVDLSGGGDREELSRLRQGRRPNQAKLSPPPTSSSTRPPPANATVTSRFSCLEESRVPRFA